MSQQVGKHQGLVYIVGIIIFSFLYNIMKFFEMRTVSIIKEQRVANMTFRWTLFRVTSNCCSMFIDNHIHNSRRTQLSPAIILMSGGAHEGGMLQSDLFTRRSQNLVSGKLRRSGFWRYGQFFK